MTVAPFGLPSTAADVLDKDLLLEEYTALYRLWEDIFSRLIYTKRGIPDDRVAATIHRYLEVKKDKKVLESIEKAAGAMATLVEPPRALELPASHISNSDGNEGGDVVNTAKTTAMLLNQVIKAIYMAFPHLSQKGDTGSIDHGASVLRAAIESGLDTGVKNHLGLSVPIRITSPSLLGTAAFAPLCLSAASVDALKDALTVTIDVGNNATIIRNVSLVQYYTLLSLHSESEEVVATLAKYSTAETVVCGVEDLQNGALGLALAVHPTVAYVLQLKSIISKSPDERTVSKAVRALRRVNGAMRGRREACDGAVLGDMHCAIEAATHALEREYSLLEEEEDKEEDEGEGEEAKDGAEEKDDEDNTSVLPVYVRVQILIDRAEYYLEANQHAEALKDCDTVLELDSRCVAAYALRSKMIKEDEEDVDSAEAEGGEGEEAATKESKRLLAAQKKADMLAAAASDALAAFLVGGSTDLSFASAAEEAAREACRIGAKKIFQDRRKDTNEVTLPEQNRAAAESDQQDRVEKEVAKGVETGGALPRAWLVQSFFAGYEPLRSAFGLENIPPEEEVFKEEGEEEGDLGEVVRSIYQSQVEACGARATQESAHSGTECSEDIDEGVKIEESSSPVYLPAPPIHLAETPSPMDRMGYWVLRSLVGRLEATQEPGPEELAVVQAKDEKQKAAGYVEVYGSWVGEAEKMWEELCKEEAEEEVEDPLSCEGDANELRDEREQEDRKIDVEYLAMMTRLGLLDAEESDKNAGFSIGLKMGGRGSLQYAQSVSVTVPVSAETTVAVLESSSSSELESAFIETGLSSDDFIAHGGYVVCEATVASSSSSTSPAAGGVQKGVVVPCGAPPCPAFSWCLRLLSLPEVSAITGVTFSPSGTVLGMEPLAPCTDREARGMREREREMKVVEEQTARDSEPKSSGNGRRPWMQREEEEDDDDDHEDGEDVWEDCDDEDDDDEEDDDEVWEDCDDDDEEDDKEEDEGVDGITGKEEEEIKALRNSIRGVQMGWSKEEKRSCGKAVPPVIAAKACVGSKQAPSNLETASSVDIPPPPPPTEPLWVPEIAVSPPSIPTPIPASHLPVLSPIDASVPATAPTPTPASTPAPLLSRSLHARLLSLCSSVAYLSGDALGAVKCLRASVQEDLTAGGSLVDSSVKLGSLLIDMDELEEAEEILRRVQVLNPSNAVVYLHQAELQIHKNDFFLAVNLLKKAQKAMQVKEIVPFSNSYNDYSDLNLSKLSPEEILRKKARRNMIVERRRMLSKYTERQLAANVYALLGVAQFRCAPSNPEISLRTLQQGIVEYPESLYLLLCTGEIISQSGDAVKAIKCFKRAAKLNPIHPLPYINAARTYVQLSQSKKALAHLSLAIMLDECLASTRVDLSQIYLLSGRTELALSTLQLALNMAKHVSEIRDVLTALKIASIQKKLQEQGVYYPPGEMVSS